MKLILALAAIAGVILISAPVGATSNGEVANVAQGASLTFRLNNAAIRRALERLNLMSLESVNALVDVGFSMLNDMRLERRLLAKTEASTKAGRAGRALLLRGLSALAESGDYMVRYGRALGSNASLGVLQVDSDGYQINSRKGKALARRGAALLGLSFG